MMLPVRPSRRSVALTFACAAVVGTYHRPGRPWDGVFLFAAVCAIVMLTWVYLQVQVAEGRTRCESCRQASHGERVCPRCAGRLRDAC